MSDPLPLRRSAPVTIRSSRPHDDARIAAWQADPAVQRWLGPPDEDRFDLMSRLPHRVWMIEQAGEPIGYLGLYDLDEDDRSAEMQICIGRPALWGRGIGRTAIRLMLEELRRERLLERIRLRVFADNERAIRCYRAAGFQLEGILPAPGEADHPGVLLMGRELGSAVDTAATAALNEDGRGTDQSVG